MQKLALRIFVGPRDHEWHEAACQLLNHAPDYAYEYDDDGDMINPIDVFEVAGRMLAYYSGLIKFEYPDLTHLI